MKKYCHLNILLILMLFSFSGFSQTVLQRSKISLNIKDASLKEVIAIIEKQSKLNFVYNLEEVAKINKVTISEKDTDLDKVLKRLLEGTGLIYSVEGNNAIIIGPAPKSSKKVEQAAIPAQLEGKVVDNNGKPIENATIRIKGVNNVVVLTSSSGQFSMRMTAENQVLSISHIGYNPKEIALKKGQQTIEIVLEDLSHLMDDIVITGISEVKKDIFSGSSTTFSGEQLRKMSSANILQGLGLLDPSFRIIENNQLGSDPNALPEIELRGGSNLGENYPAGDLRGAFYGNPNLPLFVLDGFETTLERVIDLDMNRIESLTLLKDGSAAALYGTRSANGVVVIVTKAPVEGKLRTSYSVNSTVVSPDLSAYNMLNAAELLDFEYRAGVYNGTTINEHISRQNLYNERLGNVKSGVDTYWLSQPLRTAVEQRHSLGIEGGDRTFKYNVGVGVSANPGVMKGSSRNTYQGNVGVYYSKGNLLFRNDLQLANTDAKASPYGSFQPFVYAKPYFAIPEDNGMFLYEQVSSAGQRTAYMINPLYNGTINTQALSGYTEVLNNFSAEWRLHSDFKITSSFGFSKRFADSKNFRPATHTAFLNVTPEMEEYALRGDMSVTNTKSSNYEATAYAIYNKTFGKAHQIYSQLGGNIKESVSSVNRVMAQGFPNPKLDDLAFAKQYTRNSRPGGLDNTNRLVGLLGMINYSYGSKYFGDFSFKYDGSSQFGAKTKYAPVWSAGLGWNLHKEKFIQNLSFFNSLRLTGAIAETASQNFAPYQAMTKYQYQTDNIYDNGFGAVIQGMANEDLKWQTTKQKKVALDMIFLDARLNVSAEYYWKKTANLLQSITMAPSTGFQSYTDNVGELSNNGFDIRLNVTALKGSNNKPRLTFWGNIGANKNVISKVSNAMKQRNQEILDAMQWNYDGERMSTMPPNLFTEGTSRSAIYAIPSLGIDPMTGREVYQYRDGSVGMEWRAADQIAIADSRPTVSGGFGTTLGYKGWDLVLAGSYSVGGYMYNSTLVSKVEDIDIREQNVDARTQYDKWVKPGDQALYRAFSFVYGETRVGSTSRFVQKNNYLTLSTVTLGYTLFNKERLSNWKIESLRFHMTLNDLARISTIEIERGTDYPFARRVSLGASVSF